MSTLWRLVPLALLACDAQAGPDLGPGGKADDLGEPVITFDGDFNETVEGTLMAGGRARIRYDLDRITDCRSRDHGSDVWAVTGFAGEPGVEPESFAVTELRDGETLAVEAVIELPRAEAVEFHFRVNDTFGCTAFDSDFGANYRFELEPAVVAPAVLSFSAAGAVELTGDLAGGGEVVVHYEPDRLPDCRATQGGVPQWGMSGFAQVDDGPVRSFAITQVEGDDRVPSDPLVAIDPGGELALWFEVTSVFGCHAVDDAGGALYRFAL